MKPTHKHMCAKCSATYTCKKKGANKGDDCKRYAYALGGKGELCWDCRKVPS